MDKEYITLIPTKDPATNAVVWTMIHNGQFGQGGNYPDVDLPQSAPNTKIEFTIMDINKLGITFDPKVVDSASNPKAFNAIWIANGSGAQKAPGAYPSEIDNVQLVAKNSKLVVTDKNSNTDVLTYQLNFIKPGATDAITAVDPEIRNGGKGRSFEGMDTLALVLGFSVLALVGLLWVGHLRNRTAQAK